MSRKNIRLQYSGFIIFSSQLLGIVTGLIFTLLLTRGMKVNQYGIWTNIFDYTAYFILFSNFLPFWATRFVARGKEGTAKTISLAQLTIGVIATAIYLPVIYLIYTLAIGPRIGTMTYLPIFLIAGLYILAYFMINVFEGILQSIQPQALGYGFLIEEVVKVGVALVLILGFKQLFLGAMLALVLSLFAQIGYYISLLSDEFKEKTDWSYLREWLKGSTLIAYNYIGGQILAFVFILLFFYGGSDARAYYQAALSFASVITYAGSFATALYPKLLAKNCTTEQVGTSFKTVMMLAIPLMTIAMVMSTSFLTILKTAYGIAWPVLITLSIYTFVTLITSFYSSCLVGVEAFDAGGKISIRQFVKTKIFKLYTLPYIQSAVVLPLAYFILTRLPLAGSVLDTVFVVVLLTGAQFANLCVVYRFTRRAIRIPIAWVSLAKYVLAALFMAAIMLLVPATTTLLSTIAKAIAGLGIYVALLLAIDKQSRQLVRLIWEEIKGSLKQLTSKENNNSNISGENSPKTTEN
ncbi:MAG TPA: hypothetical protein VK536_03405 [Candidatus Limnocylindrales bacterium]|nr:hypothetical protein [Candidatus Limnocylindrales bacterium]